MVVSHGCIVIDVVKPQWRRAYCRVPNDGPKWCHRSCRCNVIMTLSHHCSRRHNVIASLATSRPNFGSWISELNLRRFELKMPHLVSCDKQKMAQVRSSGFPGQENHSCDISTQKTHSCDFLIVLKGESSVSANEYNYIHKLTVSVIHIFISVFSYSIWHATNRHVEEPRGRHSAARVHHPQKKEL
jgi:hypothetical protein